ncbi:hypothetical protein IWQ56_004659 [Coemansia nantahalensis]|nr:hypothetical protein IWQ56_004659 [Coemansia nantahalensis]
MGTFGALVAQNLFTNSAAGWSIRLDWTAIYTYVVSMVSVIASFCLAVGALTRGAPAERRRCTLLFNPFAIFVMAFVFSILWVVIAGFAYRNPLPMKYPCDIFRHLRNSLQMLGIMSGKSLVEEGGLLVGICQSSKAFLAAQPGAAARPSGPAANLHGAFRAEGYSRDISPRPAQPADSHAVPPASQPERRIDDNDEDAGSHGDEHNMSYADEANGQYKESFILGGAATCCGMHDQHCHQHYEVQHHAREHSPASQASHRQRLRHMFTRDADKHV